MSAITHLQAPEPHPDIGDWWALYDYGLDTISKWPVDYKPVYPEEQKRQRDREAHKAEKEKRQQR